jgi:type II secretory pathway component PulK
VRRAGPSPGRDERGVALLSALFAVALLTVIVIEMTDSTLVHTHLTRNAGNAMAAQLLARSAELAGEALISNEDANPSNRTCPNSFWHDGLPPVPVGDGFASVRIVDEAGKLDLNAVGDARYAEAMRTLFTSLTLDPSLVDAVSVWIKSENDPTMATGAASDYCALAMSCTPRHQSLQTLEEVLLIRGFDDQVLTALRPYVTAVKRTDKNGNPVTPSKPPQFNPLTAAPLVLAAICGERSAPPPECPAPTAGDGNKAEWDAQFKTWQDANCKTPAAPLATVSKLFSIVAQGIVGDVAQTVRATVSRGQGDKVSTIWWQETPLRAPTPVEAR